MRKATFGPLLVCSVAVSRVNAWIQIHTHTSKWLIKKKKKKNRERDNTLLWPVRRVYERAGSTSVALRYPSRLVLFLCILAYSQLQPVRKSKHWGSIGVQTMISSDNFFFTLIKLFCLLYHSALLKLMCSFLNTLSLVDKPQCHVLFGSVWPLLKKSVVLRLWPFRHFNFRGLYPTIDKVSLVSKRLFGVAQPVSKRSHSLVIGLGCRKIQAARFSWPASKHRSCRFFVLCGWSGLPVTPKEEGNKHATISVF